MMGPSLSTYDITVTLFPIGHKIQIKLVLFPIAHRIKSVSIKAIFIPDRELFIEKLNKICHSLPIGNECCFIVFRRSFIPDRESEV